MINNNEIVFLTKEGLEKLKVELEELTKVKRLEIANRIKSARDMGDISENAEYDAATQEKSFVEGRINELEEILKNAKVSAAKKDIVYVGAKVTLRIDGEEEVYHIVGVPEADPMQRKISQESPLGSAMLGKKIGDKIQYEAPVGKLTYTILKIE